MAEDTRKHLIKVARIWAYPLWLCVRRSDSRDDVDLDISWWMECIDAPDLLALNHYSRFSYLVGALSEFRTLVHYRLKELPTLLRFALRVIYRPAPTLTLDAQHIGPALFIQHGVSTIVTAHSIGSFCWINQNVTVGHTKRGKPTLHNNVRVAAGAVVVGPITLHDGAIVGANATVVHDVPAGVVVVAPSATPLDRRRSPDGE